MVIKQTIFMGDSGDSACLPADVRIVVGGNDEAFDWQDGEVGRGGGGGGWGHGDVQEGGGGGRHRQGPDRAAHLTTLCI